MRADPQHEKYAAWLPVTPFRLLARSGLLSPYAAAHTLWAAVHLHHPLGDKLDHLSQQICIRTVLGKLGQ
jgi:hypothetical protein